LSKVDNEIEQRAIDYISKIDALGGALRAHRQGYIQREIQESAYMMAARRGITATRL